MSAPFYEDEWITLYQGDAREVTEWLSADVLIADVPYGIDYNSGSRRATLDASIEGDKDTAVRDRILEMWGDRPALVFGTWRIPRPEGVRARLVWDTLGALGMGDLSIPWKPSDQEIYVLGQGEWRGRRTNNVLSYAPVQSTAKNGRLHPHEKPVPLMVDLVGKTTGVVADPTAGSGSTLIAARSLGRRSVGVELTVKHCDTIVRRIQNTPLPLVATEPEPIYEAMFEMGGAA